MKTLVILSVVLFADFIWAATVFPAEAPQEQAALEQEVAAVAVVAAERSENSPQVSAFFHFCLDGWQSYDGSCYFLANFPDSWTNAESFCAGYGGNLASVHDIWGYNFLQRMVKTGGHPFAWIGGYYFQGNWRWDDGSRFDYHRWETTSSTDHFQCLQLNSQESKGWSNHDCTMPFPFVCQVKRLNC